MGNDDTKYPSCRAGIRCVSLYRMCADSQSRSINPIQQRVRYVDAGVDVLRGYCCGVLAGVATAQLHVSF